MLAATYDPQAIADDAFDRANHTGTQSADSLVDGSTNHVFTTADDTKLAGIATSATANSSDATLLARANHTGTQSSSTISDLTESVQDIVGAFLSGTSGVAVNYNDASNTITVSGLGDASATAETIRDTIGVALLGTGLISVTVNDAADTITISTTATANDTDANLKNRANHTGTQSADTITDGTTNKAFTATEKTKLAGISGTNTGDQTSIVGITGTKAQFNTAVTDGDVVFTDNAALTDTRTPTDASVTTAKIAPSALVTSSETLASSDNDTSIPTVAAVIDGLDTKQPLDSDLTTIAGLTPTTNNFMVAVSSAWASRTPAQARTTLNVADGATANDTDANLKARANHTGTQTASTISDFNTAADARVAAATIAVSQLGTGKVTGSTNGTAANKILWTGTAAEYAAIGTKDSSTVYVVTA
jgi:hypothetical protein